MADVSRMVRHWTVKLRARGVCRVTPQMVANYERAITELVRMEQEVREILNRAGVPGSLRVAYLDFARELFRLKRRGVGGRGFLRAGAALKKKWEMRGLRRETLEEILKKFAGAETVVDTRGAGGKIL